MPNSPIGPLDRTLSGTTIPGQSGPGSDGYEGVLRIPQSSSITGASPSDCLESYPEHSPGSYPSAEIQSVYSSAPSDWVALLGILVFSLEYVMNFYPHMKDGLEIYGEGRPVLSALLLP